MTLLKSCAAYALALSLSSVAFAQDATTPTADDQFPVAPATDAAPNEYTKATHGDWQIRCTTAAIEHCVLYQLIKDEAGTPVVEITMVKLPEGGQAIAGVTAVTPLGTVLTTGFAFQVDENPARQYPYNWCTPNGCFSRFGLDASGVAMMKTGSDGVVALFSLGQPKEPIRLKLSLNGFTAGFTELPVSPNAPAAPAEPAPVVDSPVTGQ